MDVVLGPALEGSSRAYTPYAWESLPDLVNLAVDDGWWLDAVTSRRMVLDLLGSTGAQGIAADVVHSRQWSELTKVEDLEDFVEDVIAESTIPEALESFGKFVSTVPAPVLGVLPAIQSLTDHADEDLLGDALCDLAREAMGTGLAALIVLGERADSPVLPRIVRLADNFGCPVISLGPSGAECTERGDSTGWQAQRVDREGHVGVDGKSAAGVILTPGDVSAVWSRAEITAFGGGH